MKPKSALRSFLLLAGSALLAASSVEALTLTWDANAATAAQTDGAGTWLGTDQWWTGTANTTWTTGDDAIFGNGGAGGAVTLASPTVVNSLTSNHFTGTYTLGTTLQAITLNGGLTGGITQNASRGITTIISPLTLAAAQTWKNDSPFAITGPAAAGSLVVGTSTDGIDNSGHLLTIGGIGVTQFKGIISGTGGLTKNGLGTLVLGSNPTNNHTYSGTTTIDGGVVRGHDTVVANKNNVTGTGNLTINDGALELYFGGTYNRALGSGVGEVQILGGTSGFSSQGNSTATFNIGGAAAALVWGSTYFSPTTFVLQASTVNSNGLLTLSNGIDLNGATRTIASFGGDTTGSATVSGAIIDTPASGAGLNKIGSGNLVLTAANTYSGATTITGAIVPSAPTTYSGSITLSGSGTLNSTSALNLNGGTLRLINTAQVDRVADGAAITSAGSSGISYANTSGANNYTESLGAITHSSGQLNILETTNQAGAGDQTLTLGGLNRSGTSGVTFSAATTGPQATGNKNMIVVTGAGTTTAGQIVGPWATVGTTAALQTDYAAYNAAHVVPAAIAGSAETTWTSATDPYTMDFSSAGTTLTATRNIGALRIIGSGTPLTSVNTGTETITLTGHTFVNDDVIVFGTGAPGGLTVGTTYYVKNAAPDTFQVTTTVGGASAVNLTSAGTAPTVALASFPTLALSTDNNLGTYGILNGSSYPVTITPGTGGSVTLPTTSAGQLHVNTGSNAITISAPIADNTGALTLVKNGSAGTLILSAANNTYTGDTIINAGTLQVGVSGSAAQLNGGSYAGNFYIAGGANLNFTGNSSNTLSGIISGDGNLTLTRGATTLSGPNTYTGKTTISLVATNSLGNTVSVSSFNSVFTDVGLGTVHSASSSLGAPTTVQNGIIDFGGGVQVTATLNYTGSGETTDRIINFVFNGNSNRVIDSSAAGVLKFTSAPTSNGTNSSVVLQGSGNGEFVQGLPFSFNNFTKSGAGTWTLGGKVGSTGTTTISGGTLALGASNVLSNTSAISLGTATLNAATFSDTLGTLDPTTASATINLGSGAALAFADSSAVVWTGGTLNITGTFVSGSSLKFGTTDAGLTDTQLDQITATGFTDFDLDTSGFLTAVPDGGGSAYDAWKAANAPGSNPDDDTDGDGVSNAVEFILGGTSVTNDIGKLPTISTSGGNLLFTFLRKQSSVGPGSTTSIEVGTNLVTWPAPSPYAVPDADTGGVVNPGVTVVAGVPAGFDTVTLRVAQAPDTKKFARLKVVITP